MKSLEQELREKDQKIRELQESLRKVRASKGTQESKRDVVELVESYKRLGLSEKEAAVAAGVESAVEHVTESQRKLIDTAKSLGMSDADAKAFATPRPRPFVLGT